MLTKSRGMNWKSFLFVGKVEKKINHKTEMKEENTHQCSFYSVKCKQISSATGKALPMNSNTMVPFYK